MEEATPSNAQAITCRIARLRNIWGSDGVARGSNRPVGRIDGPVTGNGAAGGEPAGMSLPYHLWSLINY
jgi:hypothetical protein